MGNKKIMKYCMDKYLNECIGNCKDDGVKALLLLQKDIEKNNEHHLRQQDLLLQIISPNLRYLTTTNNQKAKQAQFLAGGGSKPYRGRHF